MIGNSLLDYLSIRLSITLLRLVAPASILYLCCCVFKPQYFCAPLALIAVAEASFYLFVYLPRRSRLQAAPTHPPPKLTRTERSLIFDRCVGAGLDHPGAPYPTGWFLPKNSTPKREDTIDWLLWALFSTSRDEIDHEEHKEELDGYISGIEKLLGRNLEDGHSMDGRVKSMRITLDPVVMLHRPLVWYFIVALVDAYTSIILAWMGFKHFTPRERRWSASFPPRPIQALLSHRAPAGAVTPYWYRPHTSTTKLPLVFLHGIGIGLYPYISFIRSILKGDHDVGILLPELLPISMHMTPRAVPPRQQMLASLDIILQALKEEEDRIHVSPRISLTDHGNMEEKHQRRTGWDRVVLSAHSYGTFVAGWIIRQSVDTFTSGLADKIAHLILVDPIPILLSNPAVAHNFLYREPGTVCRHHLGSDHHDFSSLPSSSVAFRSGSGKAHTHSHSHARSRSRSRSHSHSHPTPIPKPKRAPSWVSSASAWQLWYFASRDADVARTLGRAFFWAEGGVWREDVVDFLGGSGGGGVNGNKLGNGKRNENRYRKKNGKERRTKRNMAVFLGGMDQIVPAEAVRRYLTGEKQRRERWVGKVRVVGDGDGVGDAVDRITEVVEDKEEVGHALDSDSGRLGLDKDSDTGKLEVLFNPRLDHAVIFDEEKWTVPLVDVVRRYVRST